MKAGVRKMAIFTARICRHAMSVRPTSVLLILNISQKIRWAQFSFRFDDRLSNKRWIQLRWLTAERRITDYSSAYVFIGELPQGVQCIFCKRRYHGTLLSARNHWRQRSRNLYEETDLECQGRAAKVGVALPSSEAASGTVHVKLYAKIVGYRLS